jgi:glycine/D-amino acid oxidase-like deaminating enzyme
VRVVIVGGGVIGSALAFWLARDAQFAGEVVVVERDPTYTWASSARSASSIRQQFSTPVNIAIGRFGAAFLREIGKWLAVDGEVPAVQFVEGGYLFLATPERLAGLEANHRIQRAHGADVVLLSAAQLRARFSWLNTDDLAGGSLGLSGEGWFDGWALLCGFRRKATALGARYLAAEVVAADRRGRRILSVRTADGERITGDLFVNAAGPWAGKVAALFGIELPVEARRRSVFAITCPKPPRPFPLLIDTSGVWVRPEGTGFICGAPPPADRDLPDLPLEEVDHALFDEVIWPALAHRVPAFEQVKVTNAWSGYYEMNGFDANGIVGPHPDLDNLLCANGFSGHGIQQAAAVGRGLAEWIIHGRYQSIDLSPLSPERLLRGEPLAERNVI